MVSGQWLLALRSGRPLWSGPALRRGRGARRNSFRRPRLEYLEARETPAGHVWVGGGGDNLWSNANNWLGGLAGAPQAGEDNARFYFPSNAKSFTSIDDINIGKPIANLYFTGDITGAGYNVSSGGGGTLNDPSATPDQASYTLGVSGAVTFLSVAGGISMDTAPDPAYGLAPPPPPPTIDLPQNSTATITAPIHIDQAAPAVMVDVAAGAGTQPNLLVAGGAIDDAGVGVTLRKIGTGIAQLTSANSYTGGTDVAMGVLNITNSAALGTPKPGVQTLIEAGATLQLQGNLNIATGSFLHLGGKGGAATLEDVSGSSTILDAILVDAGGTAANKVAVDVAGDILTIQGTINGAAPGDGLTKTGPGTLVLRGVGIYNGGTNVNEGILQVDGQLPFSPVNVSANAILTGDGLTGPVTANTGATVNPGRVGGPGILHTGTSVTFNAGSEFAVEINGAALGNQYDQLDVNGAVNLGGATLHVSRNSDFVPVVGTSFIILRNDGNGPVAGTFAQGNTITAGGITFTINYAGGDGNDVELDLVRPTTVYVDDSWLGTTPGSDPATDPIGGLVFGYNAFSNIQTALNQVSQGGRVVVYGGTYATPAILDINKPLAAIDLSVNPAIPAETTVDISEAVTLTNDATFVEAGVGSGAIPADLTFARPVNAALPGGAGLTINGPATQAFEAAVGSASALAFLTTDTGGNTRIDGGSVTTTGAQTYNDAVLLGAGTTLTSTGGGDIGFASTLNGAFDLAVDTAGTTTFGGSTTLASLSTDAPGTSAVNGGSVTTTGAQTYNDPVNLGMDTTLTAGAASTSAAIDNKGFSLNISTTATWTAGGAISGAGGLIDSGPGTLILTTASIYQGGTSVNGGTLLVNNTIGSGTGSGPVSVNNSAILGGNGAFTGPVNVPGSGTVSPGATAAGSTATLGTGNVSLGSKGAFNVELNGNGPGQFDQLKVTGAVDISGSTLNVSALAGFTPAFGDSYTIIDNDGIDPIIGTFAGLLEGSTFQVAGVPIRITYHGGSNNNDVVLTGVGGPATHFQVVPSVPTTVAGVPFSITVTALDSQNHPDSAYQDTVHFTTTDSGLGFAVPVDYTFTLADAGVHTFTNGVTLVTAGNQTITATDTVTPGITGSAPVTVEPAGTDHFKVSIPSAAVAGVPVSFTVTAQDQFNNTTPNYAGLVHFTSSDLFAGLPIDSPLANGVGSFLATFGSVGNQTVTGTDTITPAIFGISNPVMVAAGLHIWTGATNNLWSVSSNWVGGAPTEVGAAVVFGQPGAGNRATQNDLASAQLASITFSDPAYTLSGNAITLGTGGLSDSAAGTNAVNFPVTLTAPETWTIAAAAHLDIAGTVNNGGHLWTINAGGTISDTNVISGSGGLDKTGAGTLTLSGNNLYSGITTVDAGTLLVNGVQLFSAVTVSASATLGGIGITGPVAVNPGGIISPGISGPGTLGSSTDVIFTPGARFTVDVNGTTPGTQYDQLGASGIVDLASSILQMQFVAVFPGGTSFTLIQAGGGIKGTFAGIANNTPFVAPNGQLVQITYNPNSVVLSIAPNKTTTTVADLPPGNSVFEEAVTFTASTVFPLGTLAPGGTINFLVDGTMVPGGFVYNPLTATGTAQIVLPALSVGNHNVTATYTGDPGNASSTGAVAHLVNKAGTSTTLTASPTAALVGDTVTFTATVSVNAPSSGLVIPPSGFVTFMEGSTPLGTVLLSGGTATFSTSALPAGSHDVTATYRGDAHFTGSTSAAAHVTITRHPTTTTVTSSSGGSSVFGQVVTFTAHTQFAPGSPMPAGTMFFVIDGVQLPALGFTYDPATATATAQLTVPALPVGAHLVTATFTGGPRNDGSSGSLTETVNQSSLASSFGPTVRGNSIGVLERAGLLVPTGVLSTGTLTPLTGTVQPMLSRDDLRFAQSGGNAPIGTAAVADMVGSSGLLGAGGVIMPVLLQPGNRDPGQGLAFLGDVSGGIRRDWLGEHIGRSEQVPGVPASPVVQLHVAPVEVNVLKVITSLNDGGTNVLQFEKMLRDGQQAARSLASASSSPVSIPQTSPVSMVPVSLPPGSAEGEDVQADVEQSAGLARTWPWWLAGTAATLVCATLARHVLPRFRFRSQPE
jgi:autotransporter-associated beta strand protein